MHRTEASLQPAAKVESSKKQIEAAKLKILDDHLLEVVKIVHGSALTKTEMAQQLIQQRPDIPKSRAEKIIGTVAAQKKVDGVKRWVLLEETLKRNAFIPETAQRAWEKNTKILPQGSRQLTATSVLPASLQAAPNASGHDSP